MLLLGRELCEYTCQWIDSGNILEQDVWEGVLLTDVFCVDLLQGVLGLGAFGSCWSDRSAMVGDCVQKTDDGGRLSVAIMRVLGANGYLSHKAGQFFIY